MKRIPMKGGDEFDAFTGWRKYIYWKPRQLKKLKRAYNKRFRKVSKSKIKSEVNKLENIS